MRTRALLILAAGLLLGADNPKDTAAKKALQQLQGAWTAVTYDRDGKPTPAAALQQIKLTIQGNKATLTRDGKPTTGTYKLDPSQKPHAVDISLLDGPNKGKTALGIYELTGDHLRICLAPPGKPRPKEFKAGPGVILEVWQRTKPPPPPPPIFADKNLEAAVRAVLQDVKGPLTDANLVNVNILEVSGKKIASLKGLDHCKNLALLKISDNQISDVTPLKGLDKLQSLDLAHNQIKDITPLGTLTHLQYLELSNNQVTDIKPLGSLTTLASLYLSNNQISDISALGNLTKLASLSLAHNRVRDVTPLAKVTKLTTLDLNDNQVEDVAPLARQTEISLLMLERNTIKDLGPLVTACKADADKDKRFAPYLRLYLKGNPLSDAAKMNQLTALKTIGVRVDF